MKRVALLACLTGALAAGCAGRTAPRAEPGAAADSVDIGYGTVARSRATGAVSTITPGESDARVGRIEELLDGRVPGVEVLRTGGGNYSIRIRGVSSVGGSGTEPLILLDGMPVESLGPGSALNGISPHDVQRIEVLKDVASTAVYGMRGANGVILITTKRGR